MVAIKYPRPEIIFFNSNTGGAEKVIFDQVNSRLLRI